MRTIIDANISPICSSSQTEFMSTTTTTKHHTPYHSRLNISDENNLFEQVDEIDYLTEYICPSDSDDDSSYFRNYDDDDKNNNDLYVKTHLNKQQLNYIDHVQEKNYQRSKRSNKKINAQRQIKTKHAKSIKIKSHNKHLYIHHRLAKKVRLDEPSYNYMPSSQPVPSYTLTELRSIVNQYRHPYNSSYIYYSTPTRKARHTKITNDMYIDESQTNLAALEFREYALHEYNIPDEPSYDDAMVNFLLEMQNRDLSPEDYEMLLRLDERVQRKTVNKNILDTLPTIKVTETHLDDQCTICMEKYNLDQELKLLPCTHIFHSNCIETYLQEFSIQCPLDNLPLV
ncbi:unnamed protein product [Adineta steineri]|uniref:RING-type domain-containing protein n=1 Tax=Adineta steineri TaxID=433720 RepID=A0A814HFQ5_9BILA|nr:unnamed protein product [Adineta steineri]CAF1010238.1 unnamed protein product [Adineta steineri]CAF1062252.1 unnamed protein product [Adineta steineri]